MKPILAAIMAISFVSLLAGAGTLAYFSDTETSGGNTFTAGVFHMCMKNHRHSLPFNFGNKMPGFSDYEEHWVKNNGTIAGTVNITAENFIEPENIPEIPEPEPSIEVGPKDFADVLHIKVYANKNHNYGDSDAGQGYENDELIYDGSFRDLNTTQVPIASGELIWFKFEVSLPADLNDEDNTYEDTLTILAVDGNEDDNAYQADGVQADIVFYATTEDITI